MLKFTHSNYPSAFRSAESGRSGQWRPGQIARAVAALAMLMLFPWEAQAAPPEGWWLWNGSNNNWNTASNWSVDGVPASNAPTATDNLYFGNSGVGTTRLGETKHGNNVVYARTSGDMIMESSGDGTTYDLGSFTTELGATQLTIRSDSGSNVPGTGRDTNLLIANDFTINSTVLLGDPSRPWFQETSSIYNVGVGGTTFINADGHLIFTRIMNSRQPEDGRLALGNLEMQAGARFDLTSGSGTPPDLERGTLTTQENFIYLNHLQGTGTLRADKPDTQAAVVMEGSDTGSFAGLIEDGAANAVVRLIRDGEGTQALTSANTFSGGTTVREGQITATHHQALGTGSVELTGAGEAILRIESDTPLANTILFSSQNAGSRLERVVAEDSNFDVGTSEAFRSNFENGRRTTTVSFAAGTASQERILHIGFSTSSAASNDSLRLGDIVMLEGMMVEGTEVDVFVLQLELSTILPSEDRSFLAWFDGDKWVNAIQGNSSFGSEAGNLQGFMGSFEDSNALATAAYLGAYGLDLANNTVWAVLDHNSQFAVIPEPSTALMFLAGVGLLMAVRRPRRFHAVRKSRAQPPNPAKPVPRSDFKCVVVVLAQ